MVSFDPPPDGADNYALGPELARGGMATIFSAEDIKLQRFVALKSMSLSAEANPSARKRFVREAQVLARLAHPNIVPIHDIVWENGEPLFYTMKLVRGRTLQAILHALRNRDAEALRQHSLPSLLTAFQKVCDAIAFAHSHSILHRDLKPENIMIGQFGEVLVMDWGLAKSIKRGAQDPSTAAPGTVMPPEDAFSSPSHHHTLQGTVMGTPQYMSPEQAAGQNDDLDERSDIFSLGAVLYAILTLNPPVEGDSVAEILAKVRKAEIESPAHWGDPAGGLGPGSKPLPHVRSGRVPAALAAVVKKALKLDKADRYQSATELSADIAAYQEGFATQAEEASALRQLLLLMRRHKHVTSMLVIFLAVSIGLIQQLISSEHTATHNAEVAVEQREAARHALAKSALALAEAGWREGDGTEMRSALQTVPDDLRNSTWQYLNERADNTLARIQMPARVAACAPDPSRPSVFFVSTFAGQVAAVEVRSGKHLLDFTTSFARQSVKDQVCSITVSSDGRTVALGSHDSKGGIAVHDARNGQLLSEWKTPPSRSLSFSPDGTRLLQIDARGQRITVWDARNGTLLWNHVPKGPSALACWMPDGQTVALSIFGLGVQLVAPDSGKVTQTIKLERSEISAIAAEAPHQIVVADRLGFVSVLETESGTVKSRWRVHSRDVYFVTASPNGNEVVTAVAKVDGHEHILVWNLSTGSRIPLMGSNGQIETLSRHPVSGEVVVVGAQAFVWDLADSPPRWFIPASDIVNHVRFWSSDDQIFAPSGNHGCTLVNLQRRQALPLWAPSNPWLHHLAKSADGQVMAIHAYGSREVNILCQSGSQIRVEHTFNAPADAHRMALDASGARLAYIGNFKVGIHVLDTATGGERVKLDTTDMKWFSDVDWFDGGRKLIALVTAKARRVQPLSEEWIALWDGRSGKLLRVAKHDSALETLRAAPDGHRLAEGGADRCVRIRDADTLQVIQEFRAHDDTVISIAWHPTRPLLATASLDRTVKIWNLVTGRCIRVFQCQLGHPSSLDFSPSGSRLACACWSDGIRVWEVP